MTLYTSIWLFQVGCALGLGLWLTISLINNLHAFQDSTRAIGRTMSMSLLAQPPKIETPLLKRAMSSPLLHKLALYMVMLLKALAAISCWIGCYALVIEHDLATARLGLNLALSSLISLLLFMFIGGSWFGYWIKQEELQLEHLGLLIWSIALFALFNGHWI